MTADRTESVTETTVTEPNDRASRVTTNETTKTDVGGSRLAARVIRFITAVVATVLLIRLLLIMLNANQSTGFVDFILDVTRPLVAPFRGIFGNPADTVRLEPQTVTAIVVYVLIGAALAYLVRIKQPRS